MIKMLVLTSFQNQRLPNNFSWNLWNNFKPIPDLALISYQCIETVDSKDYRNKKKLEKNAVLPKKSPDRQQQQKNDSQFTKSDGWISTKLHSFPCVCVKAIIKVGNKWTW